MKSKRIYVAGHAGMVGSAIVRKLKDQGCENVITRSRHELDLTNQAEVQAFFKQERIDYVILAAAKVGGIHANNTYAADFIYQNLMIQANVINSAYEAEVDRLLFLGGSCIYPNETAQPIKEEYLLTGNLEPTNEPYAIAKITGIKLCESYNRQYGADFRSVMPTSLYGPSDNYHPENSHVIPALIRRFHEAKLNLSPSVTICGTGKPRREFLYVDDMAEASFHVLSLSEEGCKNITESLLSHINVGSGKEISIMQLSKEIAHVIGYSGLVEFDSTKLDGTPRKLIDSNKIFQSCWQSIVSLYEGLQLTYSFYNEAI